MLKACIEIIPNGQFTWIPIPNGDLGTAISDFTEGKDWEFVIVTGEKIGGITNFPDNTFHECDIYSLNNMFLQANDFTYSLENLVAIDLLLRENNHDCDVVIDLFEQGKISIYQAIDMEVVAHQYLENTGPAWYEELKENRLFDYFDFKSYGEEILESEGTWLKSKRYGIIVEVFE